MPFLEDIGPDDGALEHPIWGAFSLIKDRVEQLIALNLVWSLQLIPALIALAFQDLPLYLRIVLFMYSGSALAVALGGLYELVGLIFQHESPRIQLVKDVLKETAIPSLTNLAPLYGLLGVFFALSLLVPEALLVPRILCIFIFLLLAIFSMYWGPIFTYHRDYNCFKLLQKSVHYVWQYPAQTALSGFVILLTLVIGAISIGGLFLIVPILVIALQTLRYNDVFVREKKRKERRKAKATM